MPSYPNLFSPGKLGSLTTKNRIVMPAIGSHCCNQDCTISDQAVDYYRRRAKGGAGAIIVEATNVHPTGKIGGATDLSDRSFLPGHARLAQAIKAEGARAFVQLYHPGRQTNARVTGHQPVAPSAIRSPVPAHDPPRALSRAEIQDYIEHFARAAAWSQAAGYDGVEIHGAHGYLIAEFLSSWSNQRTDEYGGDLVNRARFAVEIVREARRQVTPDFPILFRLSVEEHVEQGITLPEAAAIARLLVENGIDAIDMTAGNLAALKWMIQPMTFRQGFLQQQAVHFKQAVSVPVIMAGRIVHPSFAEELIASGTSDFVAIGRGLLCDPDLPRKAAEDRTDEIRHCIGCNWCADRLFDGMPIECLYNPELGAEGRFVLAPVRAAKRVLVAGGGPAGLEAARVLAERGHRVEVYERGPALGGQVLLAAIPDWKQGFAEVIRYYERQLQRLGVTVHLNTEVTAELVQRTAPDSVVVATGAEPLIPDLPGVNGPQVVVAEDLLTGKVQAGRRVVIIGGGYNGCETALFLSRTGHEVAMVTIMRRQGKVGQEIGKTTRWLLLPELEELGVRFMPGVQYEGITPEGIIVRRGEEIELVSADTVVVAAGYRSVSSLRSSLAHLGIPVFAVGDCVEIGDILTATHQGAAVGMLI